MQLATHWLEKLNMQPHPEGGFYVETFRANILVETENGKRSALTSIFYLLEKDNFSGFHRIKSPELWYFHAGSTLLVHEICANGQLVTHELNEQNPFVAIQPTHWFAAEVANQNGYVLVSCAVAPGFDFTDFEMADVDILSNTHPKHEKLVRRLSR